MDYSYLGSGKIFMREAGAAAGLIAIGNCSALSFNVNEDNKELQDYTQPGGGTYNEVKRINSVEMAMTAHDLSPVNLSRALFGNTSAIAAASITDEVVTGYHGALAKLLYPNPTTVVVQDVTDTTTYTVDVDYTIETAGIIPLSTGAIGDGDVLHIDYDHAAMDVVEAITESAKEYEIVFEGLNEARSGKAVVIHIYRQKLGAAQNLSLIGDDYAALEISGKVLKDTTKTGAGVSQYFKATLEV